MKPSSSHATKLRLHRKGSNSQNQPININNSLVEGMDKPSELLIIQQINNNNKMTHVQHDYGRNSL